MWRAASSGAHPQDKRFFGDAVQQLTVTLKQSARKRILDNAGAQTAILVSSMSQHGFWCEFQSSGQAASLPAFSPTAGFGPKR